MRTLRRTVAGVALAALLWGVGVGAAEPSQTEVAWATIRDGVFVDEAEWKARFTGLDANDRKQVRMLLRLVRNQRNLIDDVAIEHMGGWPRIFCLYEAAYAAAGATEWLEGALTAALEGQRKDFRQRFREGQEQVREYWALRDGVDCSTAAEVAATFDGEWPFRPVSGQRVDHSSFDDWGEVSVEDDVVSASGLVAHERFEWSDPLLPPDVTSRRSTNFLGPFHGVTTSSLLLEGPEGYWTGTLYAYTDRYGFSQGTWLLAGHGVYDDLSAMLTTTEDTYGVTADGGIFPAPLPVMPEPLGPAAE